MWQYNYTQQPELYHYGVKGMKWGHRKAARVEKRVLKKYRKAAVELGNEDYLREKAAKEYDKYDVEARSYEQQAKYFDKQGKHRRAEAARRAAESARRSGEEAIADIENAAELYRAKAERKMAKADKYAAKKAAKHNVSVGKSKVEDMLKRQREHQNQHLKNLEEEERRREEMGDRDED